VLDILFEQRAHMNRDEAYEASPDSSLPVPMLCSYDAQTGGFDVKQTGE
jgi:hypothetical protein